MYLCYAGRLGISIVDSINSKKLVSSENALRATFPIEVVPPLESGWSTFKTVFS